jgi:hypothetical protein
MRKLAVGGLGVAIVVVAVYKIMKDVDEFEHPTVTHASEP